MPISPSKQQLGKAAKSKNNFFPHDSYWITVPFNAKFPATSMFSTPDATFQKNIYLFDVQNKLFNTMFKYVICLLIQVPFCVFNYLTRKRGSGFNTSLQLTTVSLLLSVSPFENVTYEIPLCRDQVYLHYQQSILLNSLWLFT